MSQKRKLRRIGARNEIDEAVRRIQKLRSAVLTCCEVEEDAHVAVLACLDAAAIITRMAAELAGEDSSREAATRQLISDLNEMLDDHMRAGTH